MSDDYADGGVHSLTQGITELTTILAGAARRSQLVLVDFSASWCGPCRMMLPVLQQLAAEHRGRLAVVKVDCEQTSANQGLAQSSGIAAFPTFHLYRNQQKVGELRGADQAGLRRAIQQQLALLGPAAGSGGGGSGALVTALAAALARVKAGCSYDEFVAAAKTLLTFVGNVIDHPGEERYRRVKLSNPGFQSRLGCRAGGKECMTAIGFRELTEAGDTVLLLPEVPAELPRVRQLLQQALQQAEAAAGAAAAAERRTAAVPGPGVGAAAVASGVASNVDPTVLARALAAALGAGGAAGGAPAAPGPPAAAAGTAGPAAAPAGAAAGRPRTLRVTPHKLARVLAKTLLEAGIGVPQQVPQEHPQEEGAGQQDTEQPQQE